MGSGISDGLRHQHQQGFVSEQDTQPRNDKTPSGLNPEDEQKDPEKAFVSTNPNGNLYNTENDKPVMPDVQMTETGSNRKERDLKRLDRVKLNDHIAYTFGEGTVVGKNNMYVQIANDDTQHIDIVPIGETYFPEDKISAGNIENQMWDLLAQQTRSTLLNKINIIGDVQKAYLYRDWDDMPEDVQGLLKDINYYDAPPHGGVEGREPDHSGRNEESRSYRDIIEPKHVTRPVDDPQAPGTKKSDVEHGVYGGVVTDTPIDATDDYEDDRPKKPFSGAEAEGGATGQTVENKRPDYANSRHKYAVITIYATQPVPSVLFLDENPEKWETEVDILPITPNTMRQVVGHEMGHGLGLGHYYSGMNNHSRSIMEFSMSTWSEDNYLPPQYLDYYALIIKYGIDGFKVWEQGVPDKWFIPPHNPIH